MKRYLFAVLISAMGLHVLYAGDIRLWEGNNCTQDLVGKTSDSWGQYIQFKKARGFKNDEARSMSLRNVRAGAVVTVYDRPTRDWINTYPYVQPQGPNFLFEDDYTVITVKRNVLLIRVNSFEHSYENDWVKVVYHPANGLDGKVSHMTVR